MNWKISKKGRLNMTTILISNDDSFYAEGIKVLAKELAKAFDVTVVAPDKERSGTGHGVSLHEPIRINKIEENRYTCSGTPADCTLVALGTLYKDKKPDFVVSGINHGANLGQDRFYSGTIAAAREGVFHGVTGIATSLVIKKDDKKHFFKTATHYIVRFMQSELAYKIPKGVVLNINVPNVELEDISGVAFSAPGFQKYTEEVLVQKDPRGNSCYWIGGNHEGHASIPGTDCNYISNGFVSFDLQDMSGRNEIEQATKDEFSKELQTINW